MARSSILALLLGVPILSSCTAKKPDPWEVEWERQRFNQETKDYARRVRESIELMERGDRALLAGRKKEAEADYRRAVGRNAKNAEAYNRLARLCRDEHRFVEARTYHRSALVTAERNPWFQDSAGITELLAGDPKKALVHFDRALALLSTEPSFHIHRAFALYHGGKKEEAIRSAKEGIRREPKHAANQEDLGFLYHSLSRFDEAEAALLKSIQIDPKRPTAHHWLGQVYTRKKDPERALSAYEKAVELSKDNVAYLRALGLEMARNGKLAAARKTLLSARKLSPYDRTIGIALAKLPKGEGDEDSGDLGDPDIETDPDAIAEIWEDHNPPADETVQDLIALLKDEDWKVRHRAKVALVEKGKGALSALRVAGGEDLTLKPVVDQIVGTIETLIETGEKPWEFE